MLRKNLALLTVLFCLVSFQSTHAHEGAVGIVKERMKVMEFIAQNVKMIAPFIMGSLDMNYNAVAGSASQISMAVDTVLTKFPEGSLSEESEAKPEIWQNWNEFETLFKKLATDAGKLAQMAKDEEFDLMEQFQTMTSNCKTCHTKFRQKKH